jgi:ketosteroid isomerase-like protein
MTLEDRLRAVYAAFNARDIDRVLGQVTDDVDWPNAWEGGRVSGHEGVREYWTRQWAAIDPHVEPIAFTTLPDGRIDVEVHQHVRSLDGEVLVDGTVHHVYTFRDGRVSRMEVATGTAPA